MPPSRGDPAAYRLRPRQSPWHSALCAAASRVLVAGAAILAVSSTAQAQAQSSPGPSSAQTPSQAAATPASTAIVDATAKLYELADLRPVRSTIALDSQAPAFFHLAPPASIAEQGRAYVVLSACSAPAPPSSSSSGDNSGKLPWLLQMVISTDAGNTDPAPSDSGTSKAVTQGGFAAQTLNAPAAADGLWVGVYPPPNAASSGNVTFELTASYRSPPSGYSYGGSYNTQEDDEPAYVLQLGDTDTAAALLSIRPQAFTPDPAPAAGIMYLPTARTPPPYLNNSACAIRDAFNAFNASLTPAQRGGVQRNVSAFPTINSTLPPQYTDFLVPGLQPSTNYTAWPTSDPAFPPTGEFFYGPAIKFVTKSNRNCRLVYDLDFCPDVGYATAIGPDVSTAEAMALVNETLAPIIANFTQTLYTFPCGTPFGQYSYIATCADCEAAYRRWACSIALPRCTDVVANTSLSAASQDGSGLTGAVSGPNTGLLPYVVNRERGGGNNALNISLGVSEPYGELLPCLGVCHMTEIMCPPVVQWLCPEWDITAQRDYGTWADSGAGGHGQGQNGGFGPGGARFGGVQRYISTDNFGHTYCNALGTDMFLRQNNRAAARGGPGLLLAAGAAAFTTALTISMSIM